MQLRLLVPLFIAAFIVGCTVACIVCILHQTCKRRRKRNARETDDLELGVIVSEGASKDQVIEVECENEPAGCRTEISYAMSAEVGIRYIDSEDTPGASESEVSCEESAEGRVRLKDSVKGHTDSEGEVVLHSFAKFQGELSRDVMHMAQMKRGGTVVINHWIPPSYDDMLRRATPNTRMLNVPYEYGALSRIFDTSRQGHDGAVIIDLFNEGSEKFQPTVRCSGFTFPNNELPPWHPNATVAGAGTRRTSALHMSHYTNCSILVVSEDEGGCVSHFRMGERQPDVTNEDIRHILEQAYQRAYVLKAKDWPFSSSDVIAEKTALCERSTTYWAKHTFHIMCHLQALWEIGHESLTAIRKLFRLEGVYSWAPNLPPGPTVNDGQYQQVNQDDADVQLYRSIMEMHEKKKRRKIMDSDKWPHDDCLWNMFVDDSPSVRDDSSKCELLTYGPKFLGSIVYRIVDANKLLLINTPLARLDVLDNFLHFTVEILCKAVHGSRTIIWIITPELEKFILPQLEALKATRNNKLRKKYAAYYGRVDAQVFVCRVENYHAPKHFRG